MIRIKKNIFYIFVILILISASACSKKQKTNTPQKKITIDLSTTSTISDLVKIIDDIQILPLKSDKLMSVSKIIADSGYYYILDKSGHQILKFDAEGKYIYSINKRGKARDEYISIKDISLSKNCIRVYDGATGKLIDYSKTDGKFVKSQKNNEMISNIFSNKDFTIEYSSIGESHFSSKMVIQFNNEMKVSHRYLEIPSFSKGITIGQHMPLTEYNNEILLSRLLSSNIYGITKDTIYLKYQFDFKGHNITDDYLNKLGAKNGNDLSSSIFKSSRIDGLDYFMETDNYLYFIFIYNHWVYSLHYDKRINKTTLFRNSSALSVNKVWASIHRAKDKSGRFISVIVPALIDESIREEVMKSKDDISKKIINEMDKYKGKYEQFLLLYKMK